MMNRVFQLVSLVSIMLFSNVVISQETPATIDKAIVKTLNTTPNLAFGVSNERPLRSAFIMYEQFKDQD